jgi:glycerol-3-phosphate dehydrogenase subunit B
MIDSDVITCDLTVIGAGMAGMAAAVFAADTGLSIVQIGGDSEIGFASGLFDLLGIYPVNDRRQWNDPWAGIESLIRDHSQHPYARLKTEDIQTAFQILLSFLGDGGLPYSRHLNRNVTIMTPMGTLKTTYCVPQTMWSGVEALDKKPSCLFLDIKGLKGFSARLFAAGLHDNWPKLRTARISFPGTGARGEVHPEHLANALIIKQNREKLAKKILPHVKDARIVGLPAVLGLYQAQKVVAHLTELIGVPVFEIPTMPPSIPGLRLKEVFERGLREKRPHYFTKKRVLEISQRSGDMFEVNIGNQTKGRTILSKGVILATGRFIGGGLHADRRRIRETILDLPVHQPGSRNKWHREDFLDPRGHLVNQAGLEIDDAFRPLDKNGRPAFYSLFAAGSILAHQDWKRTKSGVGIAVATAFGAVKSFVHLCR